MNPDETLAKVEALKTQAQRHEKEQASAQELLGKTRAQQAQLDEKLTELGYSSWDEATKALPEAAKAAEKAAEALKAALAKAGMDVQ